MGKNDNTGLIIIAAFVGVILALYFISKILLSLGIALIIISIIILALGLLIKDQRFLLIGGIGIVLGIILGVLGGSGIDFFENNPTGKNLLDAANSIVNSTKDSIKIYNK